MSHGSLMTCVMSYLLCVHVANGNESLNEGREELFAQQLDDKLAVALQVTVGPSLI